MSALPQPGPDTSFPPTLEAELARWESPASTWPSSSSSVSWAGELLGISQAWYLSCCLKFCSCWKRTIQGHLLAKTSPLSTSLLILFLGLKNMRKMALVFAKSFALLHGMIHCMDASIQWTQVFTGSPHPFPQYTLCGLWSPPCHMPDPEETRSDQDCQSPCSSGPSSYLGRWLL